MPDRRSGCSVDVLRKRAKFLQKVRSFFTERDVLEVDTPAISRYASIDRHLDPLVVRSDADGFKRYLITSPEYHMKRLLCDGAGSIFQICSAFRRDESGKRHNPEFTILEWYRVGWDHHQLMDEVDELLQLLLGTPRADRSSYREVFRKNAGLDPLEMTAEDYLACCDRHGLILPGYLREPGCSFDDRLDFLMGMLVETRLGLEKPVIVYDYPSTQASLARIHPEDSRLSERFEVFYKGMELGNGFHELADAAEQRTRFQAENRLRSEMGKPAYALDEDFLEALDRGLPDCAGIAMGIDRMLMLALGLDEIRDAVPFAWEQS